jgi:hypothetical protein
MRFKTRFGATPRQLPGYRFERLQVAGRSRGVRESVMPAMTGWR